MRPPLPQRQLVPEFFDRRHDDHHLIKTTSVDPTTGSFGAPVTVADSDESWAIDQTVARIICQPILRDESVALNP